MHRIRRWIVLASLLVVVPSLANWHIEVVDSSPGMAAYTSIALDSAGHPGISYQNSQDQALHYARWDGSAWQIETVDSEGSTGWFSSLAISSEDVPMIAYQDRGSWTLEYAFYNVSHWSVQTAAGSPGQFLGWYPELRLDQMGKPHIGCANASTGVIQYVYWTGTAWHRTDVGPPIYSPGMALDAEGVPHFCSLEMLADRNNLYYTYREGGVWHQELLANTHRQGNGGRIGLAANGQPFIIHHETDNGQLFMHKRQSGGSWTRQLLSNGLGPGSHLAMAQDATGLPHLAYYEAADEQLMYARYDGVEWSFRVVATGHDVGLSPSIAVSPAGVPHIAYHDDIQGHLMHARWDGSIGYRMILADIELLPGEEFHLRALGENSTIHAVPVDEYIILDVFGYYFFWPGWTQAADGSSWTFGVGETFDVEILRFTWPTGAGTASGLRFWAGLFHQGTFDLIVLDWLDWGFLE